MYRRDLLKLLALAPFSFRSLPAVADERGSRTLILVELSGGNDGLNTLAPFTDPLYYKLRPRLALNPKSVLPLDKAWGLNGAMAALQPAWYAYEMAVVHGVGYAGPNGAHSRSIAIWDTASDSDDYLREGWLARQFAAAPLYKDYAADAIQVGAADLGPLAGHKMRTLVMNDPGGFVRPGQRAAAGDNAALEQILRLRDEMRRAVNEAKLPPWVEVPEGFPPSPFGQRLGRIARLMESENAAPVYKVTLNGFDTHHHQRAQHDRLLRDLAEGLAAFRKALSQSGLWEETLVLTYSEFGRGVQENATGGTDHGAAAPHLLLGGKVLGGIYGDPPSLDDREGNALRFTTDFRRLYATVVEGWWGMRQAFLPGRRFESLRCLRG